MNVDGERRLVAVKVVDQVMRHPNADALDLIRIGGWQCVTKLGEFQVGDPCVYVEIDAMLPDKNPAWQFLVDKASRMTPSGKRARLKTIRIRGQYSQGLALPLSAFDGQNIDFREPLDAQLNVIKYDPEASSVKIAGKSRGEYPSWLPKTDLERIENCFGGMTSLGDVQWILEEKLEGSSCTVYSDFGELGITSRNIDFKLGPDEETNTFITTAMRQGLDLIALTYPDRRIALRGELCGPGIQGNIYKLDTHQIFIFDVYDGIDGRYLTLDERDRVLARLENEGASIFRVPVIGRASLPKNVDEIIEMADGASAVNPNQAREGLAWKTSEPVRVGVSERVASFKSLSRKYLLAEV